MRRCHDVSDTQYPAIIGLRREERPEEEEEEGRFLTRHLAAFEEAKRGF